MKQQWTEIDPYSFRLKRGPYCIDIVKDVVSSIQEETAGQSIVKVHLLVVDIGKLSTDYVKLRLTHNFFNGCSFRYSNAPKNILFIVIVSHGMYERIYCELILLFCAVDDEIGPEEHEVRQLVSLSSETSHYQVKDQSSEPTSRNKDHASLLQIFLAFFCHLSIIIFFFGFTTPFPEKLLQRSLYFRSVVGSSAGIRCIVSLSFFFSLVDVLNNLIKKGLVMLYGIFHHNCLSFLVPLVKLIASDIVKEIRMFFPHICTIIGEGSLDFLLVDALLLLTILHSLLYAIISTIFIDLAVCRYIKVRKHEQEANTLSFKILRYNIYHKMSKQLRPSSGKTQPKRASTPCLEISRQSVKDAQDPQSKFKSRFEDIKSSRDKPLNLDLPATAPELQSLQRPHSSKSKFLQRYNYIKSSRQNFNLEQKVTSAQQRKKQQFENNKKLIFLENKLVNMSIQNSLMTSLDYAQADTAALKKVSKNFLHAPSNDHLRTRPVSAGVQFVELSKISIDQLILRTEESAKSSQEENYPVAYWKVINRFVSLIPLEKNEKVSFEHPNILAIYAQVTLNQKRYVISDEYKNCSLKNLLEEFGPFQESLGKRYLKQIALGLQHMHYHRRGHNRLTIKAILYNKNGELFINAVRSTSFVPSRDDLANSKEFHYFAPEFLLSKGFSRSLKNDVWALGCLTILMLTPTGLTRSPLHPYNFKQFGNPSQERMIDNLMQLHTGYFSAPIVQEKIYKSCENKVIALSEVAKNFISSCFKILSDERPSIETLLQHQFFQGI